MWQYILRRIFVSVIILFIIALILYLIIRAMPGDYIVNVTAGKKNVTPEMVAQLRYLYGLDTGVLEGYFKWLGNALRLDFGNSFTYHSPVTQILGERILVSFSLMLPAFFLELLIGVPLGIFSATRPYSKTDYSLTTLAFIGLSVPSFFLAVILKRTLGYGAKIFPPFGLVTATEDYTGFAHIMDYAWHLVLPVTVLAFTSLGIYMRYSRSSMIEALGEDYIRTARAKGLPERTVIYSHGLRNALIPIVTLIGADIPALFGGAIITENLFAIPGIGWMGYQAMIAGDIPLVMAFNIFLAALVLLGNLLADISYAFVDPRVRLS